MASDGRVEEATLAEAVEVTVEVKPGGVVEEIAAVPAMAVAAAEAAPVTSKRAAKKSKKPKGDEVSAADAEAENNKNIAATIDHPYLSFLHKRIRLYKKKLEKIKALETARTNDGKKLNDQQQELVGNKGLVEKMIAEFESLREQFIDVYLTEEAEKKKKAAATGETAAAKEKAEPRVVVEEEESMAIAAPAGEDEVAVAEHPVAEAAPPPVVVQVEMPARDAFGYAEDLLRTLHAVTLHQALGEDVPPVLDYFSKVLLGTTRPPAEVPFEENLAESLEEAKRYLTKSDKIVALNFTYQDLRAMVEKLGAPAVEDVGQEQFAAVDDGVAVPAPAAEELPHINFFTDAHAEPEEVPAPEEEGEAGVTEDKESQHDATPEAIELTASEEEEAVDEEETPVVEEEPPVAPAPVAAPPKSFAAAAAGAPPVKNAWSRKPNIVATPAGGSGDEKQNQRRRSQGRSKSNNSSPRNADDSNADGAKAASNGNNKPRRPRPQRSSDENGSFHANRSSSAGGNTDERRPRSERPFRKQPPPQSQSHKETTSA